MKPGGGDGGGGGGGCHCSHLLCLTTTVEQQAIKPLHPADKNPHLFRQTQWSVTNIQQLTIDTLSMVQPIGSTILYAQVKQLNPRSYFSLCVPLQPVHLEALLSQFWHKWTESPHKDHWSERFMSCSKLKCHHWGSTVSVQALTSLQNERHP